MEHYTPGIGVVAGVFMLKWDVMDKHILLSSLKKPYPDNSSVNVFINFESVMKQLTYQRDISSRINFHKQKVVIELESAILNLVANYRMYFKRKDYQPKVYLYYTSLDNFEQQMTVFNKYYRSYYYNQYMVNPQYKELGALLNNIVIPEVKMILEYIDGCYMLESKSFDSSVIPIMVSDIIRGQNVIITGDIFDTLYLFNPKFVTIYIKRHFKNFDVISDVPYSVMSIIKDQSPFDLTIFNSELYYRLLLSIKGSSIRNIKSAKGLGYKTFVSILREALMQDIVLRDYSAIDSILGLFNPVWRDDIKEAFLCTSIDTQYGLTSEADINNIKSQIVDRVDNTSVEALNNRRFLDFPINLPGLLDIQ